MHSHNNKSILNSIFKAIKSLQKPNDKYIRIMYIYVATFTPRNPEPEEAPVWEVALWWTDPRECHRGSGAALTWSLEQT